MTSSCHVRLFELLANIFATGVKEMDRNSKLDEVVIDGTFANEVK